MHPQEHDFGVIGRPYPIEEEDLISVMKRKLLEKEKNGELIKEMQHFKNSSENFIKRPRGINLPRAQEYQIKAINISYIIPEDITDAEGKIIYKAGTAVNPLKIIPLSKALCFFDGNDLKQVEWVLESCGKYKLNKLIMTSGKWLDLSKKYQKRFYFDQQGLLVTRLGVSALPAKVRQKGDLLYVEEFPLK